MLNKSAKSILAIIILSVLVFSMGAYVLANGPTTISEKTEHGKNIADNDGVILSADSVLSCFWKPDPINDGYKICEAIIELENTKNTEINLESLADRFQVDFAKDNVKKEQKEPAISYHYSLDYELYDKTLLNIICYMDCAEKRAPADCKESCSYQVERKRWTDWTDFRVSDKNNIRKGEILAFKAIFEVEQYQSNSYNFTLKGQENNYFLDPDVSACGTLNTAGGVYTQIANITDNGLTDDCIIISNENITYNGNGNYIQSDDLDVSGIYSNQMNTTIKNTNVSIPVPLSIGIELGGANNSYLFKNTLVSFNGLELTNVYDTIIENLTVVTGAIGFPVEAIKLTSSSDNTISNSSLTCYGTSCYGVNIVSGGNNTIKNTTIISDSGPGDYGIYFGGAENIVQDSNITGFDFGIYLNANSNRVFRNTIENNVIAVQINGKDFNVLENNTIFGCSDTGADTGCVYLADGSDRNNMTGGSLDADSDELYGVFISSDTSASANNRFRDFTIEPQFIITRGGVKMSGSSAGLNNVFLNVTYNSTWTVINSCSSCELVRKWYLDINLTILGFPHSFPNEYEANTIFYRTEDMDDIIASKTTVNHRVTFDDTLIGYINKGGTRTYYSHTPTVYASHDAFYPNSITFNIAFDSSSSNNVNKIDNITLEARPPAYSVPPTAPPFTSTTLEPEPKIIYIPENKTYCGDLICQREGNDYNIKENFWNCAQDCPGAIGENFDELIYSFFNYCWDKDPSTVCFWTQQLFSTTPGVGINRTISCGDNICGGPENFINCKEDCGGFNVNAVLTNCSDDDPTTPCFWNTNLAIYVLFGGFGGLLALSMIKIKVSGERKKVSGFGYIKLKYKKTRRKWRK